MRVEHYLTLLGVLCLSNQGAVTFIVIDGMRSVQGAFLSSPAILCSRNRLRQSVIMRGAEFRVAAINLF